MDLKEYISGQLNAEQTKAALHCDTSSLILAGAGSGKTRVLTYKIAYLLYEKKVKADEVLAVTFTNKAAKEMKERLVKISEEISAKNNLADKPTNEVMDFDALVSGGTAEAPSHSSVPHYNA